MISNYDQVYKKLTHGINTFANHVPIKNASWEYSQPSQQSKKTIDYVNSNKSNNKDQILKTRLKAKSIQKLYIPSSDLTYGLAYKKDQFDVKQLMQHQTNEIQTIVPQTNREIPYDIKKGAFFSKKLQDRLLQQNIQQGINWDDVIKLQQK